MTNSLTIIAGPDSIEPGNVEQIYQIAHMTVKSLEGAKQKAIAGTRVVGLKSRTGLNSKGDGMGIDFDIVTKNLRIHASGGKTSDFQIPPSVKYAEQIAKETNLLIATEVMMPSIQLPVYEGRIPAGKFMPWNPAVNQLGWSLYEIAHYVAKHDWHLGIKNGKWVGEYLKQAEKKDYSGQTSLEKVWAGLADYSKSIKGEVRLIHRGVDVAEKGDYRSIPVHEQSRRVKLATRAKLYFDPSHSFGPKMVDKIVPETVKIMKMKLDEKNYLYDGILIEVGNAGVDTDQHITLKQLQELVDELASFRVLVSP